MGVSYSKLQTGAYALILAQVDGPYRIPVVVGPAEAQSIAIRMEGITPPRPMTHDLFASLMEAYSLTLEEVFIHNFEDGIFSAKMIFTNDEGHRVELDSRTSDAIAVAMRTDAPIYTTQAILRETGFLLRESDDSHEASDASEADDADDEGEQTVKEVPDQELPLEELRRRLDQAIANEQYEEAARLSAILKSRQE